MDAMLAVSLVSFLGLVASWLALPASKQHRSEPTRVTLQRRSAAEA